MTPSNPTFPASLLCDDRYLPTRIHIPLSTFPVHLTPFSDMPGEMYQISPGSSWPLNTPYHLRIRFLNLLEQPGASVRQYTRVFTETDKDGRDTSVLIIVSANRPGIVSMIIMFLRMTVTERTIADPRVPPIIIPIKKAYNTITLRDESADGIDFTSCRREETHAVYWPSLLYDGLVTTLVSALPLSSTHVICSWPNLCLDSHRRYRNANSPQRKPFK